MNNIDLREQSAAPKDAQQTTDAPAATDKPQGKLNQIIDALKYILLALIVVIPIRAYIAQPFIVQGNSMFPTLHNHEYLIVNEMVKLTQRYTRGDVVILHYPNDPSRYFVKRIIGLPGETVTIKGTEVTISGPMHTEPFVLNEPYVAESQKKNDFVTRSLNYDEFFVMGDNRAQSSDSRIWGPVPREYMDGTALLRLFPFTSISLKPGSISHFGNPYEAMVATSTKQQ
jgi:signal peptidase I